MGWRRRAVAALAAAFVAGPAVAQDVRLPVLVPLTGFVALEGTSQRNGALLAAASRGAVVSLQLANGEVGTRQPLAAAHAATRAAGVPLLAWIGVAGIVASLVLIDMTAVGFPGPWAAAPMTC